MEFEVEDGQLRLRRWTRFMDTGTRDPYMWRLAFGVEGMAGAVVFEAVAGEHFAATDLAASSFRGLGEAVSTVGEYAIGAILVPRGVRAHAYRPWPTGHDGRTAGPCEFLLGGQCYCQEFDDVSRLVSGPLLRTLANPGGLDALWRELERRYVQEFCPPVHFEEQQELERLRATVAAYERARQAAATHPLCVACEHPQGAHDDSRGACRYGVCGCSEYVPGGDRPQES